MKYLQDHTAMLARLDKGPDGTPLKNGWGARVTKQKSTPPVPRKTTSRKKTAAKGRLK